MARAGFCSACNANVWLADDGSCVNGHPAAGISGIYETSAPVQVPVAKRGMPAWAIVLIVIACLAVVGPLCLGMFTAISVPVFMNASGNAQAKSCFANQRTIVGAAMTYVAMNEGAAVPSDMDSLMAVVVPSLLKREPTCPAGGAYSIAPEDGSLRVECSIHGSYDDQ